MSFTLFFLKLNKYVFKKIYKNDIINAVKYDAIKKVIKGVLWGMNKNKKIIVSVIGILIILAILAGAGYMWYSKKKESEMAINNPEDVVSTFSESIKNKDYDAAYVLLSDRSKSQITKEEFSKKYEEIYGNLHISEIETNNLNINKIDVNNSKVSYNSKLKSAYGEINFDNSINLQRQSDKKYYIDWDYNVIYPGLLSSDKLDIKKEYAKRGSLIDRNGVLLAGGGYIASVGLVPGWMNEETKEQDIAKVAELLGITVQNINKKMSASYVKSDTFVELTTISKDKQTTLAGLGEIDGVKIKDIASRVYPLGEKAAHLTGYVQKANAKDMENNKTYDENSLVGRAGLESVYEERLKGKDGYEISIVNEKGEVKKTILKTEKEDGENIKLTIDSNVQETVYATYSNDNSATVVMNPKTGEVLAMVSTPSYDPNKFIIGMTNQEWNEISNNANNPLYTRFLRSYAPGSSFKPVTGAIALQTSTINADTQYEASGTSWQKDNSWGSYNITTLKTYNEPANLLNALVNSDNIFFAKTALKIGKEKMEEQLKKIGFEDDIGFEMGLYKSQISNEGKFVSDVQLADSGYGQGQILLNPVHFASIYSAFANDGNMIMPYIEFNSNKAGKNLTPNAFSKEVADEIKKDLIQVVESPEGTAHSGKIDGLTIAGKTGTAETKSAKGEDAKEIGWFNCFVVNEDSNKQLLVVSMVENVENKGGSTYVVNKVKNVIQKIIE